MQALDNQIAFISVNESGFFKPEKWWKLLLSSANHWIWKDKPNRFHFVYTQMLNKDQNVIKLILLICLNYCFLTWYSVHFCWTTVSWDVQVYRFDLLFIFMLPYICILYFKNIHLNATLTLCPSLINILQTYILCHIYNNSYIYIWFCLYIMSRNQNLEEKWHLFIWDWCN